MQQVLLNMRTGETELIETPVPALRHGHVLIRTRLSLISAGTERMLVDFGRASMLERVRQQPDKVRQVIDKVRTDGLFAAMEAVQSKLDQPLAMGYSNVGVVEEVGSGVTNFNAGDRVVSNGSHAGLVCVPKNLCARIPDGVEDESAVFTVLSAIGLEGLRLAQPTIGESFVVVGLGLIGLLTVQLLRAHGCRVLGIDYDSHRLQLAQTFGAAVLNLSSGIDPVLAGTEFSRGRGVDAVLITASSSTSEPVSQAAKMCRKRGRIVLVGVTGLELSRQDFYEKELTFQVSCSYGPGRYDSAYEKEGRDYPVGYVRWTAQRNFEAVLDLMESGALDVERLISHRFPVAEADQAYSLLTGSDPSLGILLHYPLDHLAESSRRRTLELRDAPQRSSATKPTVACIGAGNYGSRVLIPALAKAGAELDTLVTMNGLPAVHFGKKFGFRRVSTSTEELFTHKDIDTVVIATRHDSHASLVSEALASGRNVFVEKPLALTRDQLTQVEAAYSRAHSDGLSPVLLVGFNRRFSPHVQRMREVLRAAPGPKSVNLMMNAGPLPSGHWTQNPEVGGGRILGEACHLIDLARFLVGTRIVKANGVSVQNPIGMSPLDDTAQISLKFEDGSIASIEYYGNGHRSFPKERVEVFASGMVLHLDNFRTLRAFGCSKLKVFRTWRQDKGHANCVQAFVNAIVSGQPSPIPAQEIFEVSRVSIDVAESLHGV